VRTCAGQLAPTQDNTQFRKVQFDNYPRENRYYRADKIQIKQKEKRLVRKKVQTV
jgi:hypothetical protein